VIIITRYATMHTFTCTYKNSVLAFDKAGLHNNENTALADDVQPIYNIETCMYC